MKYRKLGQSDIAVSEISLGCWTMGGRNWVRGNSIGWADVDETEIQQAIDYALDHGVNHFDNADVYGNGKAERMLARVLGNRTNDVVIATKVGHAWGTAGHPYEPQHIRHQCEQSLINLKRETIDLYYFHHGDFGPGDQYLDDAMAVMNQLRDEGKIRLLGLSAYSNDDFTRLVPTIQPDVLQSWAHIMDDHFIREGEPVRKLLEERGMSFVAFSPLNQGLLLNKFSAKNPPEFVDGDNRMGKKKFTREALEILEPRLEKLEKRFGDSTEDLARVALQYLLHEPVVGAVIPGFRNLDQVQINLAAQDKPFMPEEIDFIRSTFS
ncbi:MAG: aldo/keto reductase [Candidatus Marinimicrobia bacterium]|nr:aldo/keto reductase [Candidatus Neomarinimicrobiota bacterium]MCF7903149.1 aldo/keto reductase [Candidatus Neomarinimicrobiota bacterium]